MRVLTRNALKPQTASENAPVPREPRGERCERERVSLCAFDLKMKT